MTAVTITMMMLAHSVRATKLMYVREVCVEYHRIQLHLGLEYIMLALLACIIIIMDVVVDYCRILRTVFVAVIVAVAMTLEFRRKHLEDGEY